MVKKENNYRVREDDRENKAREHCSEVMQGIGKEHEGKNLREPSCGMEDTGNRKNKRSSTTNWN